MTRASCASSAPASTSETGLPRRWTSTVHIASNPGERCAHSSASSVCWSAACPLLRPGQGARARSADDGHLQDVGARGTPAENMRAMDWYAGVAVVRSRRVIAVANRGYGAACRRERPWWCRSAKRRRCRRTGAWPWRPRATRAHPALSHRGGRRRELLQLTRDAVVAGRPPLAHVARALSRRLRRSRHGFAHARCAQCGYDCLIAFSCKGGVAVAQDPTRARPGHGNSVPSTFVSRNSSALRAGSGFGAATRSRTA